MKRDAPYRAVMKLIDAMILKTKLENTLKTFEGGNTGVNVRA